MQVKLLCDRVGERFRQEAGSVVSLDRKKALALVKSGSAERVEHVNRGKPVVETASIGPPANAMRPMGAPRIEEESR